MLDICKKQGGIADITSDGTQIQPDTTFASNLAELPTIAAALACLSRPPRSGRPHGNDFSRVSKRHWGLRSVTKNKNRTPTLGAEHFELLLSPSVGARFADFATPVERELHF